MLYKLDTCLQGICLSLYALETIKSWFLVSIDGLYASTVSFPAKQSIKYLLLPAFIQPTINSKSHISILNS